MLPANDLANPLMARLITTLVDKTTVNWGPWLFPLMFNCNTSFEQETQKSLFSLMFGTEPQGTKYTTAEYHCKLWSQSVAEDICQRFQVMQKISTAPLYLNASVNSKNTAQEIPYQV